MSIICPDPYFYEHDVVSYELGSVIREFEFPFSNESLTEPLICFGDYGNRTLYEVDYHGDIEVGATIRIRFVDIENLDVLNIYDVSHNKKLTLDFQDIQSKTGVTFNPGGSLVINAVRGSKEIYYEEFGKKTSIIGAFDIINFPWMYLTPGENQFGFDLDQTQWGDLVITIEHRGAYGGV